MVSGKCGSDTDRLSGRCRSSCGSLFPTGAHLEPSQVRGDLHRQRDARFLMASGHLASAAMNHPRRSKAMRRSKAVSREFRLALAADEPGEVGNKTVPKMCLVFAARPATIHTRTFIPHRVHEAIGVLGALSVATACVTSGSVPPGRG